MSDYEERSSDESDAGSLEDFIADSEEDEGLSPDENDCESVDASNIIQSSVIESGVRRSTRRTRAPTRYVDDNYIRLMTEDMGSDQLSDSEPEDHSYNASDDEDYRSEESLESESEAEAEAEAEADSDIDMADECDTDVAANTTQKKKGVQRRASAEPTPSPIALRCG